MNLLRAYRYPQVAACARGDLTPERFLDGREHDLRRGRRARPRAAAPGDPRARRAMYEAAIVKARRYGALDPRLLILLDETANIAPLRNLAAWLSQCGDHGIVDRDGLAVDRADRPALRPRRARRDLRGIDRPGIHPAAGGAHERRVSDRAARGGAGRERLHLERALQAHAERRPSEGRSVAVAAPDRAGASDVWSTGTCRPRSSARPDGSRTPGSHATPSCWRSVVFWVRARARGDRGSARAQLNTPAGRRGPVEKFVDRLVRVAVNNPDERAQPQRQRDQQGVLKVPVEAARPGARWSASTSASRRRMPRRPFGVPGCDPASSGRLVARPSCSGRSSRRSRRRAATWRATAW